MHDPNHLHDTPTVARLLGLSEITLRKWRVHERREGPAWIKCGKAVRYREADLQEWLARQTVSGQ
ncbi:MAG: helix-turn-helix domain-containing protein [Sphingomonadales bacterium]|nr:helix-turn-helix domain-containing protein [Sphingomonadales bacterium]